ncbi:hypothetical protein CS022_05345 [Veronia nyctiphanis]|uniref:Uncharacterized protein n=1 Tax=Veronia nyctiphanis TaxID=1278244 RepID=A0A4Q0YS73_9GAMM|nr:hypothetical protein [Veronia nyctiphanis]RXJ74067.1 hypothetical protein CS022_05345 [Veronia nyctiphanis]
MMENMSKNLEQLLDEALEDYHMEDFASAHKKYEWYFENAEKFNPHHRGVRVSFALADWVDVAKQYRPAMTCIIDIRKEALNKFNETKSIESFRDYSYISEYLQTGDEVLEIFFSFHSKDKELAKKLFKYAYKFLVDNKEWSICAEYMDNSSEKYDLIFHCYDIVNEEDEFDKETIKHLKKYRIESLKKDIVSLFSILSLKDNTDIYEDFFNRLKIDLKKRGLIELLSEI